MRDIILHWEAGIYLVLALVVWAVAFARLRSRGRPVRQHMFLALAVTLPGALLWPWYSGLVAQRRAAVFEGIAKHRQVEALNRIQPGEKLPQYERATTELYKVGGRFFLVPKAYAMAPPYLAFYWTSAKSVPARGSGIRLTPAGPTSFREQAVEMFIHVAPPKDQVPVRTEMEYYEARGELDPAQPLFPGVVRRDLNRKNVPSDTRAFCIATSSIAPDGLPAVTVCPGSRAPYADLCGTSYWLRPNVLISTSMHSRHIIDWPAISQEIYRVMNLVKEEQP